MRSDGRERTRTCYHHCYVSVQLTISALIPSSLVAVWRVLALNVTLTIYVYAQLRPNSITLSSSVAGRRSAREPASELDSIIEFGTFHYAI